MSTIPTSLPQVQGPATYGADTLLNVMQRAPNFANQAAELVKDLQGILDKNDAANIQALVDENAAKGMNRSDLYTLLKNNGFNNRQLFRSQAREKINSAVATQENDLRFAQEKLKNPLELEKLQLDNQRLAEENRHSQEINPLKVAKSKQELEKGALDFQTAKRNDEEARTLEVLKGSYLEAVNNYGLEGGRQLFNSPEVQAKLKDPVIKAKLLSIIGSNGNPLTPLVVTTDKDGNVSALPTDGLEGSILNSGRIADLANEYGYLDDQDLNKLQEELLDEVSKKDKDPKEYKKFLARELPFMRELADHYSRLYKIKIPTGIVKKAVYNTMGITGLSNLPGVDVTVAFDRNRFDGYLKNSVEQYTKLYSGLNTYKNTINTLKEAGEKNSIKEYETGVQNIERKFKEERELAGTDGRRIREAEERRKLRLAELNKQYSPIFNAHAEFISDQAGVLRGMIENAKIPDPKASHRIQQMINENRNPYNPANYQIKTDH